MRKTFDALPLQYWILLIGTFITRAGNFVIPMLFVYLTQRRGMTLSMAGSVVSTFGVGSLVGTLLGGVCADAMGRRKTMLYSLISSAVAVLLLGLTDTYWQTLVVIFFLGLCSDAYKPACQAYVADIIPPRLRMKAFTWYYWVINLGFSVAAIMGGFFATRNLVLLFVLDAVTTLMLTLLIWHYVDESHMPAVVKAHEDHFVAPFLDRRFLPFIVLHFFVILIFYQHITALAEDMRFKGFSPQQFGFVIASNGILVVLLQPFIVKKIQHQSKAKLLAIASLLTGVGFGLTAFAETIPYYISTIIIWTLGEIIFSPVNASLVAELSPVSLRGRYQGAFGLTWSLSVIFAPMIGAVVIEHFGLNVFWLACFFVGTTVAVLQRTIMARILPRR